MFVRLKRTAIAACALVLASGSALAGGGGVTVPTVDLGFSATQVVSTVQGYLVPFLVASIGVFFAFFAVRRGVDWIAGFLRR